MNLYIYEMKAELLTHKTLITIISDIFMLLIYVIFFFINYI